MKSFRQFCVETIANSAGSGMIAGMGAKPGDFPAGPLGNSQDASTDAELEIETEPSYWDNSETFDPGTDDDTLDNDGDTADDGFDHDDDDNDVFMVDDEIVNRCNVPVQAYQDWLAALGSSQSARMLNNYALHNRHHLFILKGKQSDIQVGLKHDGVNVYRVSV